ncbi:haloacid dehalogenase type II [Amycolatopsis jejuensis]|uniref:haloacid dehalogenase type II n=1 Tax=Amycolatopsis jejuensis TaxID=330084 RepID=UPI000526AFFB|nr:haloacid dehalogenase type II [Amycolatopsis jejuensis]
MAQLEIDVLVFDVLGTLVDEPAGIRAGIRAVAPDLADPEVDRLLSGWQEHVEREQARIVAGERPYVTSDVLDREAAETVGHGDPAELALAARRLPPWPDTVDGLARLAERFPLIGLSNASRTVLLELSANAGLRWHTALSVEEARTYKPAPDVYRLAATVAGRPPERMLMVAAHAWDLRGAQAAGLRTAYVGRPVGDPPAPGDRFDLQVGGLAELADRLVSVSP